MNNIEKLNLDARKYCLLRKIFRALEAVTITALIIVFVFINKNSFFDIFGCLAAAVIVPESFLAVQRSLIKMGIKNEIQNANFVIELRSQDKDGWKGIKDKIISHCTDEFQKENLDFGWLSGQIEQAESECNNARQTIEKLKSIKRLVSY